MKEIKVIGMPTRAISDEQIITIEIYLPLCLDTDTVKLLFCKQKYWFNTEVIDFEYKCEEDGYKVFAKRDFSFNMYESRPEYVHYCCFEIKDNSGNHQWIKYNEKTGEPVLDKKRHHWEFTVYRNFDIPKWMKGAIMYQIFVDRFFKYEYDTFKQKPLINDREYIPWNKIPPKWESENGIYKNNEFYGGNLKGIQKKLGYLKKLNVDVLYLTPIMFAKSNHRYDTIDYSMLDPEVGSIKDLIDLCAEAKKLNMHIILDMVFNHTSNVANYTRTNPDWYLKNDKGEFLYWWNFGDLRILDKDNQEFQSYIFGRSGIVEKYLEYGVDGIRLDVADDLNDYFIAGIKDAMKRNPKETVLYGEVWDNAVKKEKDRRQRKYLLGKWLDSVMNYVWMDAMLRYVRYGNHSYLNDKINEILKDYPPPSINSLMNIVGTHDTARVLNILGGEYMQEFFYETDSVSPHIWDMEVNSPWKSFENGRESFDSYGFRHWEAFNEISGEKLVRAKRLLKVLVVIQYFLPGIPCVFYGDEVGITGYKDPFNRKSYPWTMYQDVDLLSFYRRIGITRNLYKSIVAEGDYNLIKIDEDKFIFERIFDNQKILIAVNRTNRDIYDLKIPAEYSYKNYKVVFSINNSTKGRLNAYGCIVLGI